MDKRQYIYKVVSSRSIRRHRNNQTSSGGYNYLFGDLKNPFNYSKEVALEDCVNIEYTDAQGNPTGNLKIICFCGKAGLYDTSNIGEENNHYILRDTNGWQAFFYMVINKGRNWGWNDKSYTYNWQLVAGWHAKKLIESKFISKNIAASDVGKVYTNSCNLWGNTNFL